MNKMPRTTRTGHELSLRECIELDIYHRRGDLEGELIKFKEAEEIMKPKDLELANYGVSLMMTGGSCGSHGIRYFGSLKGAIESAYSCFKQIRPRTYTEIDVREVSVDIKIGEVLIEVSQFHWEDYFYNLKETQPSLLTP